MNWEYDTILHDVRRHFKLTHVEYCIMNMIANLASHSDYSVKGWCNASNKTLGSSQDVTPEYVSKVCTRLEKLGLLEKNVSSEGGTTLRRSLPIWDIEIEKARTKIKTLKQNSNPHEQSLNPLNKVQGGIEQSTREGINKDSAPHEQSLTYNNNIKNRDNNLNTSTAAAREEPEWLKKEKEEFLEYVENWKREHPPKVPEKSPPGHVPPKNGHPGYNWDNLKDVLLADDDWVIFACHTLGFKNDGKNDLAQLTDLILDYILQEHGLSQPLNPDYPDLKEHIVNLGRIKVKQSKKHGNNTTQNNLRDNGGATAVFKGKRSDWK